MTKCTFLFLALWVGSAAKGFSQPPDTTLGFDTSNMKVKVTLDRQTYLPGEVAVVTLEVSNPASVPVTSLTPFISDTGCINFRWNQNGRWGGSRSKDCVSPPVTASNTTTFTPGETKKLVLNSYDTVFEIHQIVMEGGGVPTLPGEFGIAYWYGTTRASAPYTVAAAQLEAEAVATMRGAPISDDPTSPIPYSSTPQFHVLALRSESTSYICVPQKPVGSSDPVATKKIMAGKPSFDHPHVMTALATPLKRVGTSSNPVVSLSATADADGNLTIEWTDSTGTQGQIYYPASYPAFKRQ